jgi:hypothetical protein
MVACMDCGNQAGADSASEPHGGLVSMTKVFEDIDTYRCAACSSGWYRSLAGWGRLVDN